MLEPRDLGVKHLDRLARLGQILVDVRARRLGAEHPLHRAVGGALHVAELGTEVLDLGLEHRDLDALGVGGMIERGDDAGGVGDFRVLRGERVGGRFQRRDLLEIFLLGLRDLAAERLRLGREFVGHRGFFQDLGLEQVDRLVLARDVAELGGYLGLELLDRHFEPAGGQRELGAQVVLVRLDLRQRHRDGVGKAALGKAHRTLMDEGNEDDREQTRDEEATAEIHDRFDHERNSCFPPVSMAESIVSGTAPIPADAPSSSCPDPPFAVRHWLRARNDPVRTDSRSTAA